MFLYFKTQNNFSYEQPVELSMVAGNYSELQENLVPLPGKYEVSVLKSTVIYGANASGKSNILKAITSGINLILNSTKEIQIGDELPFFPNKNNKKNNKQPTSYTFGFFIDGSHFEYYYVHNNTVILEEKLIEFVTQKPTEHFHRIYIPENDTYEYSFSRSFTGEKEKIKDITNNVSLFLSVGAQFKLPVAEKVFTWIKSKLVSLININSPGGINTNYTLNLIRKNPEIKVLVLDALRKADFLIKDIQVEDKEEKRFIKATTFHEGRDENGQKILIPFDLDKEESVGTRRFLAWIGVWLDVLAKGRILFIDELGNSMHTLLSKHLITMFHNPKTNPNNAQLIFTTHDTNMMDFKILRRDQIWVIDRDEYGNSSLVAISDFKIKKGKILENSYLQGVYGGIPHIIND